MTLKVVALRALEQAGALLRDQSTLRVVPDLLAEHILHEACIDNQGASTGYAEEVFDAFAGLHPVPLMRNLGALSWRLREAAEGPRDFLAGIWNRLKNLLRSESPGDRLYVLRMVVATAYDEPQRALEAIATTLNVMQEKGELGSKKPFADELLQLIVEALGRILHSAFLSFDSDKRTARCLDLLWWVGRDDARRLDWDNLGNHGLGVLRQFARYQLDKPVRQYEKVLDAVERWLAGPTVFDHAHTPLPVLDAILKRHALELVENEDGRKIRESLAVTEQMGTIRGRALEFVYQCARSARPKVVLQSLDSLRPVLRGVPPAFNHVPQKPDQWVPEQLAVIRFLKHLVTSSQEPLVHKGIAETLALAASEGMEPRVLEKTLALMESMPDSFEIQLTRALTTDLTDFGLIGNEPPQEFRERWPSTESLLPSIVTRFAELGRWRKLNFQSYGIGPLCGSP